MPEEKTGREKEELREIFKAIIDFINQLKEPVKEFLDYMYQQLDGAKIGEDVANFYARLVEKGVPKELAEKMTQDYLKTRLQIASEITNIASNITKMIGGGGGFPRAAIIHAPGKKPHIQVEIEEEEKKEEKKEK